MSSIQRFLKAVLPRRWAEDMEAESRAWTMRCGSCGAERSVWDAGGVRWKAKGKSSQPAPCSGCGQVTTHETYKKPG